jgi:hypothetical protein
MSDTLKAFNGQMNDLLDTYVKKPTLINGIVHLLLILYAAKLAPQLPASILKLFDNTYFKLFVFSMILWTSQFNPSTAILIAIAFLVSTNYLNNKPLLEFLDNTNGTASVAPDQTTAVNSAMASVQPVMQDPVHYVDHQQSTMVIQPTIVPCAGGNAVLNPSVVIAPMVVTMANGQTALVTPKVTTVQTTDSTMTGNSGDSTMTGNSGDSTMTGVAPVNSDSGSDSSTSAVTLPSLGTPQKVDMSKISPLNAGEGMGSLNDIPVDVSSGMNAISTPCFANKSYDINKVTSYDPEREYGMFKV